MFYNWLDLLLFFIELIGLGDIFGIEGTIYKVQSS